MAESSLTTASVLSAASEILTRTSAGYQPVAKELTADWPVETARLFEDPLTIVAVCVFETWTALESGWQEVQSALVELMSKHLVATDAKAWDGYLVLLTAGRRSDGRDVIERIRYDTGRVRKLVSSAPELTTVGDVEHALLPLLPLTADVDLTPTRAPLDVVGDALRQEFDAPVVDAMLAAFADQRPMVEAIHNARDAVS
jgi:hypothetical protein